MTMENNIVIEAQYKIRLYETGTIRFLEWTIPRTIFDDLVDLDIEKGITKFEKETKLCKYFLSSGSIHIKRKDIYSTIGFALPLDLVVYLIENKNNLG